MRADVRASGPCDCGPESRQTCPVREAAGPFKQNRPPNHQSGSARQRLFYAGDVPAFLAGVDVAEEVDRKSNLWQGPGGAFPPSGGAASVGAEEFFQRSRIWRG